MRTRRKPDPLLDAILEDAHRDAGLHALLHGARRRRRRRAVRRAVILTVCPLLCVGAAIWFSTGTWNRPASADPPAYVTVNTADREGPRRVQSRPDGLRTLTTGAEAVQTVSTSDAPRSAEILGGDESLLALLPGGAGFIGEEPDRRLVWFGVDSDAETHFH